MDWGAVSVQDRVAEYRFGISNATTGNFAGKRLLELRAVSPEPVSIVLIVQHSQDAAGTLGCLRNPG